MSIYISKAAKAQRASCHGLLNQPGVTLLTYGCFYICALIVFGSMPDVATATESVEPWTALQQEVCALGYDTRDAETVVQLAATWKTRKQNAILENWRNRLVRDKANVEQGHLTKVQFARIEKKIATQLVRYLRKRFTYDEDVFALPDSVRTGTTQCLGYTQWYYVVGTSIGLQAVPLIIAESDTPGPLPPGSAHVSCMVHLADGNTVMFNLVPNGFMSRSFCFKDHYEQEGVHYVLKDKRNPLGLFRRIQVLDRDGLQAHVINSRAAEKVARQQWDQALSLYNQALALNPDFIDARNNRATVYFKLGQCDQALCESCRCTELYEHMAEPYNTRAVIYTQNRDYDKAMQELMKAIEFNPDFTKAYNNRGVVYNKQGHYERALKDFNRAIRLDGTYTSAYYNRGIACSKLGRHKEALASYTKALKCNPTLGRAYVNRALVYAILGKLSRAQADLREAIKRNPSLKEAVARISARFDLKIALNQPASES